MNFYQIEKPPNNDNNNQTLMLSSVISLSLNAENHNKFGIGYGGTRFGVYHEDMNIGSIRIPRFFQPPHSDDVVVQSRVLLECVNVTKILGMASHVNDMAEVKILGDVRAHLWLLHVNLFHIKVAMDCDMNINLKDLTSTNGIYSAKVIKSRLVIDLRTQLSNFRNVRKILKQRLGKAEATKLLNKSVYFISIGSNDYLVRVTDNSTLFSSYSQHQYVDLVIGNLTYVIKEIHKIGGRKFGFVGLGPLGCFPLGKMLANGTGACLQQISPFIELHNKALSLLLQKLQKELKGFKYSLANFHDLVSQLMDHPTRYGLKEGNVACCGSGAYRGFYSCGGRLGVEDYELCEDPSEYVFFDSAHFTDKANHYLSQQMWSGNSNVVGPYNLKSLFEQ
ncbi:GDSL esterase/lipase 1-like [Senna tora]|uniref:GDSL esterase/lipase 1-like n=1 Tax=Senna tora TaxID=362788 RepID=A0A834WA23_9FABA|nr:GDSL esterase/lipase 1-like [Senna tora]